MKICEAWHMAEDGSGVDEYRISIPIRVLSEPNQREHWARKAKRTREHRTLVGLMLLVEKVARFVPCEVTLTRTAPRALDDDNLRGALKAVRDGVADALGVDDRDCRVSWAYQQRRGAPKAYSVEIGIRARPGATSSD